MSYYVETMDVNCWIPSKHWQEAYDILIAGYPKAKVDEDMLEGLEGNLQRLFYWIGFNDLFSTEGHGLFIGGYDGASRDEENDFHALAHLIADGDYIEWRGQDGMFRWLFQGGKLIEQSATITWG